MKLIDRTGQKFGRLTVIKRAPNQGRYVCWQCKCDCGNDITVRSSSLQSGRTQSCGCLYQETRPQPVNLTNKKFGNLTVIKITSERKDNRPVWECKCNCGNIVYVKSHDLVNGSIISCGCVRKSKGEIAIENILQENNINYLYNKGYFEDLKSDNGTLLRYDFILLDDNNKPYRLIEFDGEQHFHQSNKFLEDINKIKIRDTKKNEYALNHNLPLVRIPYYDLKNISYHMLMNDNNYLVKGS